MITLQIPDDTPAYALVAALAGLGLVIRQRNPRTGIFVTGHMRPPPASSDHAECQTVERIRAARLGGGIQ